MKHFAPGVFALANPQAARPRAVVAAPRADTSNPAAILAEIKSAFEEFKQANDEKLKGKADVVLSEKVERVNAAVGEMQATYQKVVDELNAKVAAISAGGGENDDKLSAEEREYGDKFNDWFRTGEGERDIKALAKAGGVKAAYEVGDNSKGGYTAPVEWDRTITDKRIEVSPMRRYASVQSVTGQGFTKLYNMHGTTSAWVGEKAARPETTGSTLAEYGFSFGELYAMPAATERILEDSEINIAAWLADEVNTEFARQEGLAFISGDGVNKPKGFLTYDATAEAALAPALRHPLGPIGEVKSGNANLITTDGLIDLVYDLTEDRSQGAALFGNRKTHAAIRKLKNATTGEYIWQPPFQAGQPAQVLGQSFNELSGLPDIAAGAIPVVFGNMANTYRIFDRVGMSLLRDPYTNKPYILFYTRKRVGGGLWNPEWMRYHRVAA